jgi:uncharacterized protein
LKRFFSVSALALALVMGGLSACVSVAAPESGPAEDGGQQRGVWVNGEGKVTVVPDIALLSVGIEVQAASVDAAQRQASEAMDAVMKALKSGGVSDRDIKTQRFSIQSIYSSVVKDGVRRQEITGYQVSNMVSVKIRAIDKAGAIIDAAARAGGDAARINNVSFTVEDPSKYLNEAREKALREAMAKAGQIAEVTGISLGKPVSITESGGFFPIMRSFELKAAAPDGAPSTPISPGETEITLNVQMVFSIK